MTDTTNIMIAHIQTRTAAFEAELISVPKPESSISEFISSIKAASEKQGMIKELRLMNQCLMAAKNLELLDTFF